MSETTGTYNRIRALFNGRGRVHQRHIDIPVHGSCSRCHHFHINCLVPHDPTAHTRFSCEECGHQMFGLGRSTTQYTLASVNTGTMATPRQCVEGPSRQAASQGETVAVEDAQDASPHSPIPGHQLSLTANRGAESPEQSRQEHMQEPCRHTMRNRLKQWCSRPRKWSISVRAMFQRLSNTAQGARPPAGPAPSTTTHNSVSASSPPSISQTPPGDGPAGEASESVTRPEPPSFSHQMNQPGQPTRERLRLLRHEKTKQRERELRSQCLCGHNCFCRNEGSASNVAHVGSEFHTRSHTQREGTRSPHQLVPGHTISEGSSETNGSPPPQGISRETSFLHIGVQFDEPRPSIPDTLTLTGGNSQRRSRFSQTPTIDTNGSSITLSGRTTYPATRNVRHRSLANSYNETSSHIPAERGMAGAFESNRDGLPSAGLTVGAIQHEAIVEPNSISPSRASSGSNPRHESHVDYGYNAEGTPLQVDGIASEHTAEEESEEDIPTR